MEAFSELVRYYNSTKMVNCASSNTLVEHITSLSVAIVLLDSKFQHLFFGLKHFRTYLLGKPFIVRCDHMAILYYRQTKELVGQQARYLAFMAEFDFEVQFRPGSKHTNADSLIDYDHAKSITETLVGSATAGL